MNAAPELLPDDMKAGDDWCLATCEHGGVCNAKKGHEDAHAAYGFSGLVCIWEKEEM